jgi:hypothetical protein
MAFGDLTQALAPAAVLFDSGTVQYQRLAADVLTCKTSAPHAGAHPFDDKAAFEFGDGADDDDDGAAQWATYFSINSRSTTVISRPCAAVVDLKALWRSVGILIFTRFIPPIPSFVLI